MNFQTAAYLRKATSRAKSDVANKLVSMFLHEVSRRMSSSIGLNVLDARYAEAVVAKFGVNCCYCEKALENDRAAVEHLDGMNRFRAGLHIPGNVVISCKKCNNEKRRDDQLSELKLATSGWQSFLQHDSTTCIKECKSCAYWSKVWPDESERIAKLKEAIERISGFRSEYKEAIRMSHNAYPLLHLELEKIYRECQEFASIRIKAAIETVITSLQDQLKTN